MDEGDTFMERFWRPLWQEAVYLHELQRNTGQRVIDNWTGLYDAE
ncbi:hypothetical protein [Primorskyibacter marinus]|nr:hypothetical protein [Primorskyibacter marinus]